MLAVHPLELLRIEDRCFFLKAIRREQLDHFLHCHDLAISAGRPPEECEEVEHRLRKKPVMLIISNSRRTVSLAQLLAIHPMDHRQMCELRKLGAECPVEKDLLWCVGDVVVAAHHQGYSHRDVVGNDGEIIDRRRVRSQNDEVVEVLVGKGDPLVDKIVPLGGSLGNAEANYVRLARCHAAVDLHRIESVATSIVLEALAPRFCFSPPLLQLGGRTEAAVGVSALQEKLSIALMRREVRSLINDLFIPFESEPLEPLEYCTSACFSAPRLVRILDAEEKLTAIPPRIEPVEERGTSAADVQIASRGGSKAETRRALGGHSDSGKEKRVRPASSGPSVSGERGIRTLDTRFHVCRFSKPVPSASRPSLREVTQGIVAGQRVQPRFGSRAERRSTAR